MALVSMQSQASTMTTATQSYFGLPIFTGSHADALHTIERHIDSRTPTFIAALNVYKMSYAFRLPGFSQTLSKANMLITDGVSVLLTARLLGCPVKERVTGVKLFTDLIGLASRRRYRVYFLGSKEEVIESVLRKIGKEHPGLVVAGTQNGFFTNPDQVVERIRESRADILFVALGSPKQEQFLERYADELDVPVRMGVGGSFDVFSGLTPRAPELSQKLGLEWLYRCIVEPHKYLRRYSQTIPVFLFEFAKHFFAFGKSRRGTS